MRRRPAIAACVLTLLTLLALIAAACSPDSPVRDVALADGVGTVDIAGRSGSVLAAVGGGDHASHHGLLVWGGTTLSPDGPATHNSGATYSLITNGWETVAPAPLSPRSNPMSFTHEGELFVLGGVGHDDAAAWDWLSDSWRVLESQVPVVARPWDTVWTWDADRDRLLMWHLSADTVWAYWPAADWWSSLGSTGIVDANLSVLRAVPEGVVAMANSRPQGFGGSPEVRSAFLADGEPGWNPLPTMDFSGSDGIGDSSPQSSAVIDSQLIAWGRGGESNAAFFFDAPARTWFGILPPPLPACELAVPPAVNGEVIIARNFCGQAAQMDRQDGGLAWREVDFPSEADVVPVWTGSEFVGFDGDGAVWRHLPN